MFNHWPRGNVRISPRHSANTKCQWRQPRWSLLFQLCLFTPSSLRKVSPCSKLHSRSFWPGEATGSDTEQGDKRGFFTFAHNSHITGKVLVFLLLQNKGWSAPFNMLACQSHIFCQTLIHICLHKKKQWERWKKKESTFLFPWFFCHNFLFPQKMGYFERAERSCKMGSR